MKLLVRLFMSFYCIIIVTAEAAAYTQMTHNTVNEEVAILNWTPNATRSLNYYLTSELGITNGIGEKLDNKKIVEWLGLGGEKEDEPLWRPRNHFHDPLKNWDKAGLNLPASESAAIWAQNTGSDWSWPAARDYFYQALTASSAAEREQGFADTFRALGQIMHLVEDMSVPAHVRNDLHIIESVLKLSNYEKAVGENLNPQSDLFSSKLFDSISRPVTFDPSLLASAANSLAPIPIGNIFDSDKYSSLGNADITVGAAIGAAIGLAEYTNANFVSNDTIDVSQYPYPDIKNCTSRVFLPRFLSNGDQYQREYHRKDGIAGAGCGETNGGNGYLLAAVDMLDYWRTNYPWLSGALPVIPILDAAVFEDYASLLLPRAAGYSSELLEYFFRGRMDIDAVPVFDDHHGVEGQLVSLIVKITNMTPDEEMTAGAFSLGWSYIDATGTEIFGSLVCNENSTCGTASTCSGGKLIGGSFPVSGASVTTPGGTVTLQFDLPADNTITANNFSNMEWSLVYRGTLGAEQDAVVAVAGQQWGITLFNEDWQTSRSGDGIHPWSRISSCRSSSPRGLYGFNTLDQQVMLRMYRSVGFINYHDSCMNQLKSTMTGVAFDPARTWLQLSAAWQENAFVEDSQFIYLMFDGGMYGIKLMNSSQVTAVEARGNIAVVPLDSNTFTNLNVKEIFNDAGITYPASMELSNVVIMQSMAAKRGRVSSSEGMSVKVDYLRLFEAGNQFDYSYCPLP